MSSANSAGASTQSRVLVPSAVFDFEQLPPNDASAGVEAKEDTQCLPEEFQRLVSTKGGATTTTTAPVPPVPPGHPKPSKSGGRRAQRSTSRPARSGNASTASTADGAATTEGSVLFLSGAPSGASRLYGTTSSPRQSAALPTESPRNPHGNVITPSKKRARAAQQTARAVRAEAPEVNDTFGAESFVSAQGTAVSGWDGSRREVFSGDHEGELQHPNESSKQKQQKQRQQRPPYMGNTVLPNWRKGVVEAAPFDPRHQAEQVVGHWEEAHGRAIAEVKPLRDGMAKFREILDMASINDALKVLSMLSVSFDSQKESVDSTARELGRCVMEECREWGHLVHELRGTMGEWLDESKRHLRTVCEGLENANFRFQALTFNLADKMEQLKNANAEIVRLTGTVADRDQTIVELRAKMAADEKMFLEIIKGKRLRTEGARTIQKRWRKIAPRIRDYHARRAFGATSVQRLFRGQLTRWLWDDELKEHRQRWRAANVIRREVRPYLRYMKIERSKDLIKRERWSAKTIQTAWRRKAAWFEYARRKEAEKWRRKMVKIQDELHGLQDTLYRAESVLAHNKKKPPTRTGGTGEEDGEEGKESKKRNPTLDDLIVDAAESQALVDELHSACLSFVELQNTTLRQMNALKDQKRADEESSHHFGFKVSDRPHHKHGAQSRPQSTAQQRHANPAGYVPPEAVAAAELGLAANLATAAVPSGGDSGSVGLMHAGEDDNTFGPWANAVEQPTGKKAGNAKQGVAIPVRDVLKSDLPGHTRSLEQGIAERGAAHDALLGHLVHVTASGDPSAPDRVMRHHGMSDLQYSEVLEQATEGLHALQKVFEHKLELGEAPDVHPAMEWLAKLPCQALCKRITLFDAIEKRNADFAPTWLAKFASTTFRKLIPAILPEEYHPKPVPMRGGVHTPLSHAAMTSPVAALGYAAPPGAMHHAMLLVQETGMFGSVPPEWLLCGFMCNEPGRETHQQLLRFHGLPNVVDQMMTDVAVYTSQRGDDSEGRLLAHIYRVDVGTAALSFTVFLRAMLQELGFVYTRRAKLTGREETRVHHAAEGFDPSTVLAVGVDDENIPQSQRFRPNPNMIADPAALGLCSDDDEDEDEDGGEGAGDGYLSDGDLAHVSDAVEVVLEQLRPGDHKPRAPLDVVKEERKKKAGIPLEQEHITVCNALMVLAVLFHADPQEAVAAAVDLETTLLSGESAPSVEGMTPFEEAVVALLLKPRFANVALNKGNYGGLEYKTSTHSSIKEIFEAFASSAEEEGPLAHTHGELVPVAALVLLCVQLNDRQAFGLQVASWCTHAFIHHDQDYDGRLFLDEFKKAAEPALGYIEATSPDSVPVDLDAVFEEAVYASSRAALNSEKGQAAMTSKYAARTSRLVQTTMTIEAFRSVMTRLWGMAPEGLLAIRKEQSKKYEIEI